MKKFFTAFTACILILLCACDGSVTHIAEVSHGIMGDVSATAPEGSSLFASALLEATDYAVNVAVNEKLKAKPEFISFYFSSEVILSSEEKQMIKDAFAVYGVKITDGKRSSLDDIDRGITVGFDSMENTQVSDCDLTVPIQIYYGRYIYVYCADFKLDGGKYVLFRFEQSSKSRYIF